MSRSFEDACVIWRVYVEKDAHMITRLSNYQVVCHFLKMFSEHKKTEKSIMKIENELSAQKGHFGPISANIA